VVFSKKQSVYSTPAYNNSFENLVNNHLERISFTISQVVPFGNESMRIAVTFRNQVKLLETLLRPYLAGTEYEGIKKTKISIGDAIDASRPQGYLDYTDRVSDWLALLMLYAYNNKIIRANTMNRTEVTKREEYEIVDDTQSTG